MGTVTRVYRRIIPVVLAAVIALAMMVALWSRQHRVGDGWDSPVFVDVERRAIGGRPSSCGQTFMNQDAWLPEPIISQSIRKVAEDMVLKCTAAERYGANRPGANRRTVHGQSADDDITTAVLSVDAGFNVGQNTNGWLAAEHARAHDRSKRWTPPLCVIGFEANPHLAAEVQQLMNGTFDPKSPGADTRVLKQHYLQKNGNRVMVLPVGLGNENTKMTLWFGKKNIASDHEMKADEGTLRADLDIYKNHSKGTTYEVPVHRLDQYFAAFAAVLPSNVAWGNLKTDIQGSDMQAILGAGDYISRFRCVTVEVWNPRVMKDDYINPETYMSARGFLLVRTRVTHHGSEQAPWEKGYRAIDFDRELRDSRQQVQLFFINARYLNFFRMSPPEMYEYCHLDDGKFNQAELNFTFAYYHIPGFIQPGAQGI